MKITCGQLRQIIREEVSRAFPYLLAEEPEVLIDEPPPEEELRVEPPSKKLGETPVTINAFTEWQRDVLQPRIDKKYQELQDQILELRERLDKLSNT